MNREQINTILAECGVENNKALTSALLTAFNEEKRNLIVETTNKALEDFAEYKSPDEYNKLVAEISSLKESSARAERSSKYKDSKVKSKWMDYVDSQFKSASQEKGFDFDKWLSSFVKDNPELLESDKTPEPTPAANPEVTTKQIGNVETKKGSPTPEPESLADAIAQEYAKANK